MEDIGLKNATEVQEEIAGERLDETRMSVELQNIEFTESVELQEKMRQQAIEQLLSDPQFMQQIVAQVQGSGERRPGEPPRGVQEFGGDVTPESLVPAEANAAEGGPTTEEFAAQEIRQRQIEAQ
jgi:hypothetical protein